MLKGALPWREAASIVTVGVALALLWLAVFQASAALGLATPQLRFVLFLALLGGTFGYCASRVLRKLQFKLWLPNK
jgi:hypothetical protein